MSIKIQFQLGHVATLKSKVTPEGFTHDWELFVKGIDNADISHYIEKVVFTLHESFPKPKRVLKEPPYTVKESGYAGFVLPIDIYFKCRDETKKLSYSYDLNLESNGGTSNFDIKTHLFRQPSEDFRRKLLRGGGTLYVPSNPSNSDDRPSHSLQPTSRNSGTESSSKKYKSKTEESSKVSTQFANLFGSSSGSKSSSSKVSPDAKKSSPNVSSSASTGPSTSSHKAERSSRGEKSDRDKKEKKKHSSPSPKDQPKLDEKKKHDDRREEKRRDKTHSKDRDRNRDKSSSKHAPAVSPKPSGSTPSTQARSPKLSHSPLIGSKSDELMKLNSTSSKHSASEPQSSDRPSSSAKKSKKDKKEKSHDSRDRDRRSEKDHKSKESSKSSESKPKDGSTSTKSVIEVTKDKTSRDSSKPIETSQPDAPPVVSAQKVTPVPSVTPTSEHKSAEKSSGDSERKHKHKKKDKNKEKDYGKDKKKERSSRNKEESSPYKKTIPPLSQHPITSSSASINNNNNQTINSLQPKSNPLNKLLSEVDKFSSDSEDDHQVPTPVPEKSGILPEIQNDSNVGRSSVTPFDAQSSIQTSSSEKSSTDKSHKRSKKDTKSSSEKDDKKRKRKSKDEIDLKRMTPSPALVTEPATKQAKRDQEPSITPSRQSAPSRNHNHPSSPDITNQHDQQQRSPSPPPFITNNNNNNNHPSSPSAQLSLGPTPPKRPRSSPPEPAQQQHSEDVAAEHEYISVLQTLQHKIMTLNDHKVVQQVVELIAETGCYEMTNSTFDFDLCVLDRSTVQRLLDYFNAPTCA